MKAKPLGLTVIFGLGLFLRVAVSLGRPVPEAVHQGKTVEAWFQEYVASADTRTSPTTPAVMNGEYMRRTPEHDNPDPAWEAFKALGEKAVPCLVVHLHSSARDLSGDSTIARPPTANQERTRLERQQAIELIHRLGVSARAAAPALLELLPESDEAEAEAVCAALRSIHPDPTAINHFLLRLGKRGRDASVLQFARQLGWSGPEVGRLLGGMLRSPEAETSRDAITLLEAAGQNARPAADQIVAVLRNPDPEIRYLAARSLSQLATNTPVAIQALKTLANDPSNLVRNVALRALANARSNGPRIPAGN